MENKRVKTSSSSEEKDGTQQTIESLLNNVSILEGEIDRSHEERAVKGRNATQVWLAVAKAAAAHPQVMFALADTNMVELILQDLTECDLDDEAKSACVKAFVQITDTMSKPMVSIGSEAAKILVDLLIVDPLVAAHAVFVVSVFHEENRKSLWEHQVGYVLCGCVRSSNAGASRYACEALAAFAVDADYAKILMECQVDASVMEALERCKGDANVTYAACLLMSRMAQYKEHVDRLSRSGVVDSILKAMALTDRDADAVNAGSCSLFWLWASDDVKMTTPVTDVVRLLSNAISRFSKDETTTRISAVTMDAITRLSSKIVDSADVALVVDVLIECSPINAYAAVIIIDSLADAVARNQSESFKRKVVSHIEKMVSETVQDTDEKRAFVVSGNHAILRIKGDTTSKIGICEMCRNTEVTHVVKDCGHACLCKECSKGVFSRANRACPVFGCGRKMKSRPIAFFMSGTESIIDKFRSPPTCGICMVDDNKVSSVFEDCGHVCACTGCSTKIMSGQYKRACPVCRRRILRVNEIKFPWTL